MNARATQRLRIACIASFSAAAVLPPEKIIPKYRTGQHAAPWIRALCHGFAGRDDLDIRFFIPTRAVRRIETGRAFGIDFTFIPRPVPSRTDPWSLYLLDRMRVAPLVKEFAPDIVHGFGAESGNGSIAVSLGLPSVVFIQGIVEMYAPFLDFPRATLWLHKRVEHDVANRATALVAETKFARDWALRHNPRARVRILPHASNADFFRAAPQHDQPVALVIGTLDRRKGVDAAVRAIARCTTPGARIVFIGLGAYGQTIRELARELHAEDRIQIAGERSREQIIEAMEHARCLFIPARMDTSPNVITEAHAAGLPVIGSDAGGIPDMIDHGRDGFVARVDDLDAYAQHLDTVLGDAMFSRKLGGAGREKVRVLNDPKRIADEHVTLYRELTGAPPT